MSTGHNYQNDEYDDYEDERSHLNEDEFSRGPSQDYEYESQNNDAARLLNQHLDSDGSPFWYYSIPITAELIER